MANQMYALGREAFLDANIDWSANNIKLVLVDGDDYTENLTTDNALDDIPAGARVATSGNLASKTSTQGTADAADVVLSTVTGDVSELVVFYYDSGVESTSLLFLYFDTATGLPVTPNGGDININFNASGIFTL